MFERTVIGIDAAWTITQPSGVALAAESAGRWQIVCAEPSYEHFFALAEGRSGLRARFLRKGEGNAYCGMRDFDDLSHQSSA